MSVEALTWAKRIAAPSAGAKYLLFMLANYAGKKGESWYPLKEIAEDMQISVDSVRRRLGELQDAGMIARIAQLRPNGSRASDVVVLLMDDETRAFAESLGWSPERAAAERDDGPESPGIEPLADCEEGVDLRGGSSQPARGVLAGCEEGGRTAATPLIKKITNKITNTPTPASRGEAGAISLREEAEAAEARWKAMKALWPFEPRASPGKARAAFFALSPEDREQAIRYAPRYVAATEGHKRKHLGNWLADRDWTGFAEQDAAKGAERRRLAERMAEQDEFERAKYGGCVIYPGSQPHAAWVRRDRALGIDFRRELKSFACGQGYLRPSRWPPGAGAEEQASGRAGPERAEGQASGCVGAERAMAATAQGAEAGG